MAEERRHRALLGKAQFTHVETVRYREQKQKRKDRCNAVMTQVLSGSGKMAIPRIQARQHVGAVTGATQRKARLQTSARARHEAADTKAWDPEKQWHYWAVSVLDQELGLMVSPSGATAEAALAHIVHLGSGGAGSTSDMAVIKAAQTHAGFK